ncbi:MAG: caspase family protein [bacterium]
MKNHSNKLRCISTGGQWSVGIVLAVAFMIAGAPQDVRSESWGQLLYPGTIKCMEAAGQYVWIGGDNGALRFDTRTNYTLSFDEQITARGESIALAGKIVKDIAMDARGRVWFACWHKITVGGGAGVSVFDGVGWHTFTKEDGLAGNDVLCIAVDSSGRVWVGTTEGLSLYEAGQWTTYTTADGLMRNDPVELYVDHLGRVWCGFWRGANVYFRDQWWNWERESVDYVYGIVQDRENRVYCATKGGFAVYDSEQWSRVMNKGDLRKRLMSSVAADNDGNIWCAWGGLDKGASVFDGENWARVTKDNTEGGLASDRTISIAKDDIGRLWFGARDGEVSVLIPDGAPGITLEDAKSSSLRFLLNERAYAYGSQRIRFPQQSILTHIADTGRRFGLGDSLPFLRMPVMPPVRGSYSIDWRGRNANAKKRFPISGLRWEEPAKEPFQPDGILLAQAQGAPPAAPAAPATQIQINNPAGLMTATEEAPFEVKGVKLDVQGMIGPVEEIDKVEVNGFEVTLQPGMKMGEQFIYSFAGSVMVPGISKVKFELFKGEKSIFAKEFPVNVPAKEPEKTPPDFHFIDPNVSQDKVVAARGGVGKISIQLSVQQTGVVRGIAVDDSGIKEVKVNGQAAFMTDPLPSQLRDYGISSPDGAKLFEHSFSLKTGPNTVTIEAVDIFDNMSPLSLDLFVQELLSDATFYQDNWAFIVGVDKYTQWPPLGNAVNDAKGMRDLLVSKFKFSDDHVLEIYDEEATKDRILEEFRKVSQAGKESRVVLFYAGHGQTLSSRKGDQGFLVPVDGAFVPLAEQPSLDQVHTWISMRELSDELGFFNAKHVLLIVDACYSGLLAAKRGANLQMIQQDQVTAHLTELAEELAVEVITAGAKNEQVQDGGYKGHSVFTGFLIKGLETGEADLDKDGVITTMELGSYVWQNVRQVTSSKQNPQYCKLPGYEEEEGTVLFTVPQGGV